MKLFCKHDWKFIGHHINVNENLYYCKKCQKYYIQHCGIGVGYKTTWQGWFLEVFE